MIRKMPYFPKGGFSMRFYPIATTSTEKMPASQKTDAKMNPADIFPVLHTPGKLRPENTKIGSAGLQNRAADEITSLFRD
jgi:hypothetical protein